MFIMLLFMFLQSGNHPIIICYFRIEIWEI